MRSPAEGAVKENDVISASEAEQLVGKELFRDEWIGRLLEREKWLIRTYQHTTMKHVPASTLPGRISYAVGLARKEQPHGAKLREEIELAHDRSEWMKQQYDDVHRWMRKHGFKLGTELLKTFLEHALGIPPTPPPAASITMRAPCGGAMDNLPSGWLTLRNGILRVAETSNPQLWFIWTHDEEARAYRKWAHAGECDAYRAWVDLDLGTSRLPELLFSLDVSDRELEQMRDRHKSLSEAGRALLSRLGDGTARAKLLLSGSLRQIPMPVEAWNERNSSAWFDSGCLPYPTDALHPERFWESGGTAFYEARILVCEEDCTRAKAPASPVIPASAFGLPNINDIDEQEPATLEVTSKQDEPSSPRHRGRRPEQRQRVIQEMLAWQAVGNDLYSQTEESMAAQFKASRDTCRRARNQVLSQNVGK
jgi:hypothetical protein